MVSEVFSVVRDNLPPVKRYYADDLGGAVLESAVIKRDVDLYKRCLANGVPLTSLTIPFQKRHAEFLSAQIPECAICMEPQDKSTSVTACVRSHVFHLECLKQAVLRGSRAECPTCRGPCFECSLSDLHLAAVNGSVEDLNKLKLAVSHAIARENPVMMNQLASFFITDIARDSPVSDELVDLLFQVAPMLVGEKLEKLLLKAIWATVYCGTESAAVPRIARRIEAGASVRFRDDLGLLAAVVYKKHALVELLASRGARLFQGTRKTVELKYKETPQMLQYVNHVT